MNTNEIPHAPTSRTADQPVITISFWLSDPGTPEAQLKAMIHRPHPTPLAPAALIDEGSGFGNLLITMLERAYVAAEEAELAHDPTPTPSGATRGLAGRDGGI